MRKTTLSPQVAIGIDVGGTFTDFAVYQDGMAPLNYKIPSTPHDPSEAIETGLRRAVELGVEAKNITLLGHGTTVATNMVIEHRGSRTALLTTKGFRDILEIGRQERPHLYSLDILKPKPLAPRHLRFECDERIDARGTVLTPIDEDTVRAAAAEMLREKVEAVAVCFIHSYRFPQHEQRAAEILREILPDSIPVCLSSEILPEFREYERFSTTVMNAYLQPKMSRYMHRLVSRTQTIGCKVAPYTIHSNGGLMPIETARALPVQTCLSGPAAGVIGGARMVATSGLKNVITFDVGGTSTDVSLIKDETPAFTTNREVAGYPVRCPMVDVHVIGAGGGSVAHLDRAGALKVGPQSAGAQPGPAGYGNGGEHATISDANIVLHRLNPVALLDGKMPVDESASLQVVSAIAEKLGIGTDECASGIIRIAVANMARAIRAVSVEKGHALEDFALMAFGGAGPLHASHVAMEVGINKVLIPNSPGTMCAQGVLMSDVSRDYVHTTVQIIDTQSWRASKDVCEGLISQGLEWLYSEGIDPTLCETLVIFEARYQGQNHEIPIRFDNCSMDDFLVDFGNTHLANYGYKIETRPIEIVNIRVRVVGKTGRQPSPLPKVIGTLEQALKEHRDVFLDDATGWQSIPVYHRTKLPTDLRIDGPAIVEELSSTTLILNGHWAIQDSYGNLVITLSKETANV